MQTSSKRRISFILPVYNVAPYIEKCLTSIENQSSPDWEVIIVDDGSTDESSVIFNRFAENNPKYIAIHQHNQGQGVARNRGIDLARGEFVCFVDPDDWIETDTVLSLLKFMNDSDADFANFRIDFVSESGKTIHTIGNFSQTDMHGHHIFENAMLDNEIYSTPCNKIYKTDFLKKNQIYFPNTRAYEDLYFSRLLSLRANRCMFIDSVYYHALVRSGSTTRKMDSAKLTQALEIIELEKSVFINSESTQKTRELFEAHVVKFVSGLLIQAAFRIPSQRDYLQFQRLAQSQALNGIRLTKHLKIKNRAMAIASRHPRLLRFAARIAALLGINPY